MAKETFAKSCKEQFELATRLVAPQLYAKAEG